MDLGILAYNQDTFPQRCRNNHPDSSEDTPENSSSRSSLVMDNLINNKNIYDHRNKKKCIALHSVDLCKRNVS